MTLFVTTAEKLYFTPKISLAFVISNFHSLLFTPFELSSLKKEDIYITITDINNAPKKEAALESLKCLQKEDLRNALEKIEVPTLLIHGKDDQISMPAAAVYMNEHIKGAELLLLDKTGHAPFITREKEVLKKLHEFLEIPR